MANDASESQLGEAGWVPIRRVDQASGDSSEDSAPGASADAAAGSEPATPEPASTQPTSPEHTSTPRSSTQAASTQAASTQAASTQAASTQAAPTQAAPTQAASTEPARASDARIIPPLRERATALSVEGLSKTYENTAAVKNLSFRASAGEILGLVGANGAGKTTTLRSIAGILPLQAGRVEVCGHDLVQDDLHAKRSLAWIPDDPQPFDSLTVDEHLRFTAALYGVVDWEQRAEDLLRTFELAEKRTALGGELSRGMRQKLAFCCAWLHQPGLVLMDEPLSGLDPRGIRSAKNAVQELADAGSAVVLSSHLLELIEELADRILILHRGEAVFSGSLDELRVTFQHQSGTLEEIFLAITESRPG